MSLEERMKKQGIPDGGCLHEKVIDLGMNAGDNDRAIKCVGDKDNPGCGEYMFDKMDLYKPNGEYINFIAVYEKYYNGQNKSMVDGEENKKI